MPCRTDNNSKMSTLSLITFITCMLMEINGQPNIDSDSRETVKQATDIDANTWNGRSARRSSAGGMWFGPRLGKRSRVDPLQVFYDPYADDDRYSSIERAFLEAAERGKLRDVDSILEFIDAPGIIAVPGGKRRFTPRLGRELSSGQADPSRSVNFTPRLGRQTLDESGMVENSNDAPNERLSLYQPRDLIGSSSSAVHPEGLRLIEAIGRPPFSPRLGRTAPVRPLLFRDIDFTGSDDKTASRRNARSAKPTNAE